MYSMDRGIHKVRTGLWKFYLLSWCLFSDFRLQFLSALTRLGTSSSRGLFIDACYAHCQTEMQETWLRDDSPLLGKVVRCSFIFFLSFLCSIILLLQFSSTCFLSFIVDFLFSLWRNSFYFCTKNYSADNCKGSRRLVLWPESVPKDRLPLPLQPHLPQPCFRYKRTPRTIDLCQDISF